jgi:hypothetical protein
MKWAGHVARMEKVEKCYMVVVGKSERKRQLGSPTRKKDDNNGTDFKT